MKMLGRLSRLNTKTKIGDIKKCYIPPNSKASDFKNRAPIVIFTTHGLAPDEYDVLAKRLELETYRHVIVVSQLGTDKRINMNPREFLELDARETVDLVNRQVKHGTLKEGVIFITHGSGVNPALKIASMLKRGEIDKGKSFEVIGIYTTATESPNLLSAVHRPQGKILQMVHGILKKVEDILKKRAMTITKIRYIDSFLVRIALRLLKIIDYENKPKWSKKDRKSMRRFWGNIFSQNKKTMATQIMGHIAYESDMLKDATTLALNNIEFSGMYYAQSYMGANGIEYLMDKRGLNYNLRGGSSHIDGSYMVHSYKPSSMVRGHLKEIISIWIARFYDKRRRNK